MVENDKIIKLNQLREFKSFQDSLEAKLSIITSLMTSSTVATTSLTDNQEWKVVYIDNEDKVLFGINQDNKWKLYVDLDELLDNILSLYITT